MIDAVVERNRKMLLDRSTLGLVKYGAPLHNFTDERGILQHALEEALDLANYLQTRIMQIDGELPHNGDVAAPQDGYGRVKAFHEAFGLPVNHPGYEPTPEERLLRGKLMLEEVLEHLIIGLGLRITMQTPAGTKIVSNNPGKFGIEYRGDPYNAVETLDGLCDVKVIANGTGVAFGLPVPAADTMIFESNMSKLGPDGQPIINGVTPGYRGEEKLEQVDGGAWWRDPEEGYRPDLPHGKVLKPASFVAPDIASLL